jgi:hypothetical protein
MLGPDGTLWPEVPAGTLWRYLPQPMDAQQAWLARFLGLNRRPLAAGLAGEPIQAAVMSVDRLPRRPDGWMQVSDASGEARLLLPVGTLSEILKRLLPGEDLNRVAEPLKLMMLEEALEPALRAAEVALHRPVHLATLSAADNLQVRHAFGVLLSGETLGGHPAVIDLPEWAMPALLALIETHWPPLPRMPLHLAASLRFGFTVLPLAEVFDLRSGDAVLLDGHLLSERKAVAVIEEHLAAPCLVDSELKVLTDALVPAWGTPLQQWCGSLAGAPGEAMLPPDVASLRLDFDGWSGFVAPEVLAGLAVGGELPITAALDTRVQIRVAGRVVGGGEIVQLSERFAVRVDHLRIAH